MYRTVYKGETMKKQTQHITAWVLKYSDDIKDLLYWKEGHGGIEYAVLDAVFKNKGAFNNLPKHMKKLLVKVRLTIEEEE